ncbi:hypothetical protein DFH08DRAFT_801239 [Mycena albidolilacea]|uniref:Uncharacterized protein n=1 Tax=Mycena albidolilacea TaxID=1033008 RepID=A0AAD7AI13_9AGAR|nr:hypothetical protein DFH08DRAFT_801239 [Mycena albidolilacea]
MPSGSVFSFPSSVVPSSCQALGTKRVAFDLKVIHAPTGNRTPTRRHIILVPFELAATLRPSDELRSKTHLDPSQSSVAFAFCRKKKLQARHQRGIDPDSPRYLELAAISLRCLPPSFR